MDLLAIAAIQLLVLAEARGPLVAGPSLCPTPEAVAVAAAALQFPDQAASHQALITGVDGGVELSLRDEADRPLGLRRLESTPDCAALASAAALVLWLWEREPFAPALPPPGRPAPLGPAVRLRSDTPPTAPSQGEAPSPTPRGFHLDLGLGPLGSLASAGGVTLAGTLSAALLWPQREYGLTLSLGGEGARALAFAPGSVSWSRWSAALGGERQWRFGPFAAVVQTDLALGLLATSGSGFAGNNQSFSPDGAVRAGGRLLWGPGATQLWLGALLAYWPLTQQLVLKSPAGTVIGGPDVPSTELLFGFGVEQAVF